jgi:hypothetical protein
MQVAILFLGGVLSMVGVALWFAPRSVGGAAGALSQKRAEETPAVGNSSDAVTVDDSDPVPNSERIKVLDSFKQPDEPLNDDEWENGLSARQRSVIRFLAERTGDAEHDLAFLLAKPEAIQEAEGLYDQFTQALGDALERKEQLLGEAFEAKRKSGDYTEQGLADPLPTASNRILVVSGVFWDKSIEKDIRRVARIWPGEFPALDIAVERYAGVEATVTDTAKSYVASRRRR